MNKSVIWILIVLAILLIGVIAFKMGANSKSKQVKSVILEGLTAPGDKKDKALAAINKLPAVLPGLLNDLQKINYPDAKPAA